MKMLIVYGHLFLNYNKTKNQFFDYLSTCLILKPRHQVLQNARSSE